MTEKIFDEQSLRLLRAYFTVEDGEARELIVALAEAAAKGAKIEAHPVGDIAEKKSSSH